MDNCNIKLITPTEYAVVSAKEIEQKVSDALNDIYHKTFNRNYRGGVTKIFVDYLSKNRATISTKIILGLELILNTGCKNRPVYTWNTTKAKPNLMMAMMLSQQIIMHSIVDSGKGNESRKINKGIAMTPMLKHCSKCGEYKPLSDFGKSNKEKSGLRCQCKECDKNEMRVRRHLAKHGISTRPENHANTLSHLSDEEIVLELRNRGYNVSAIKTIKL